ncbi:MAG: nucleotidyltransferase family protein [Armatimonadota bacterium]
MLNGMILAAGYGTRLSPLTRYIPKPLFPVGNRPVMAYGIDCLRSAGVFTIAINVSYQAQQIEGAMTTLFGHHVDLRWVFEQAPTGTAGGFKKAQQVFAGSPVILIAGDAMLHADLTPLIHAHQRSGAFASLATVTVDDPSSYGVVLTDTLGRIQQFQEKPAPGTELSHRVNTGIYLFEPGIFDLIPAERFCDFALDVFPEILRRGLPFYAFPLDGYWKDIGNLADYLQANSDDLGRRIGYRWRDGNLISPSAQVEGARLENCVVGDHANICQGCALTSCVVWPETQLDTPMILDSAVVSPWETAQLVRSSSRIPCVIETVSVR